VRNMGRIIKPNFVHEDDRGILREITRGHQWRQLNEYERKKGSIVGNHYHKTFEEFFFIIKGACTVKIVHMDTKKEEEFKANEGDAFRIFQMEAHTIKFDEDTIFITLLSENFDSNSPDLHPFEIKMD